MPSRRNLTKPEGPQVRSEALIACRFGAKLIDITGHTRSFANLAGLRRTRQRGRGVEFDEVRAYSAGDDIRTIDWRVTARSGTAHTKLFHEDREQPVIVAIDQRSTMKFGSQKCFKSVLAAFTGSVILWSALESGERVGGVIMGDDSLADTRPQRSSHAILRIIGDLVRAGEPTPQLGNLKLSLEDQFGQLDRISRAGAKIFLISDFHDLPSAQNLASLRRLARRCHLVAISISDILEEQLPLQGRYAVTDGVQTSELDTRSINIRNAFANQYKEHVADIGRRLKELRIPLLLLRTSDDPIKKLLTVFPAK